MKQITSLALLVFFLTACNNSESPTSQNALNKSREELIKDIGALEQKASTQQTLDYQYASSMVAAYLNFFNHYPKDASSADYLFKAGEISMNIKQGQKAIELFQKLNEFYPNDKKCSFALFLQGFIYETQLNNAAKAREIYNKVIQQYPNTKMADDAKASIANLGKTDEELVKEFEKKNGK